MARLARYDIPDHPQHVIQRGNNRGVPPFFHLSERRVEPAPRGRPRKQEAHDVAQRDSDPVFPCFFHGGGAIKCTVTGIEVAVYPPFGIQASGFIFDLRLGHRYHCGSFYENEPQKNVTADLEFT
jgi:hypothetical protein